MTVQNRQFRLAARPVGLPKPSDWTLMSEAAPTSGEGQFLARQPHFTRPGDARLDERRRSYIAPVEIGAVMRAQAGGEVVASNHQV
jgi:NADPH-dependent curcumin reductase CurA